MKSRLSSSIEFIYKLSISICFISILAVLCGFTASMSSVFIEWEHSAYVDDSVLINLLAVLLTIVIAILFKNTRLYIKLGNSFEKDHFFSKVKSCLILIIFAMGSVWALSTQFIPGVDEWEVMNAVKQANRDEYHDFIPTGYMDWYPNQWGLFLFEYCISQVFGSTNYLVIELLNALAIAMIYKHLSEIGAYLGLNRIGQLCILIVGILFFPTSLYASMVYGNMLGVCFALAAVKYELYFFQSHKWKDAAICSACIGFGIFLKSNMLIYFLGIVFSTIVKVLTAEKNRKAILGFLVLLLTAYLFQSAFARFAVETMSGYKLERPITSLSFVAMGLQDCELAPGWWSEYTVKNYYNSGAEKTAQNAAAMESIKESLVRFAQDPEYALNFFTKKVVSTWANPTFQCFGTIHTGSNILPPDWVNWILTYNAQYQMMKFLNLLCFIIYAGALLNAIFIFTKKDTVEEWILPMIFVGGFVFHLFWETKARYAIMYFVVLIPYAVQGYSKIAASVTAVNSSNRITRTNVIRHVEKHMIPIVNAAVILVLFVVIYAGRDVLTQDTDRYQAYLAAERMELRMVPFDSNDTRSKQLNKAKSMVEYCNRLREMEDITVAVAVRDIQGYCLRDDEVRMLEELGFRGLDVLLEHTYHSFIGVATPDVESYQLVGGDELISEAYTMNGYVFDLTSATWQNGDTAKIIINGVDCAVNRRGFNIVVIDNQTGNVIDTVAFDTHVEGHTGYRNNDYNN